MLRDVLRFAAILGITAVMGDDAILRGRSKQQERSLILGGYSVTTQNVSYPGFAWSGIVDVIGGWGCGGALIHEDIVMTAGHCQFAFDAQGFLYLGPTLRDGSDGELVDIEEIIVHPDFDSDTMQNDILLMQITRQNPPPPPRENKRKQFLFQYNTNDSIPRVDDPVSVIGFGTTSEGGDLSDAILQVEVNVYASDICNETYYKAQHIQILDNMHLCTGTVEGGKDACDSDSGSPLFLSTNQNDNNNDNGDIPLVVVGITSDGIGCGHPNIPSFNTKVSGFSDWIHETICEYSQQPPPSCSHSTKMNVIDEETPTKTNGKAETSFWTRFAATAQTALVSSTWHQG